MCAMPVNTMHGGLLMHACTHRTYLLSTQYKASLIASSVLTMNLLLYHFTGTSTFDTASARETEIIVL